MHGHGAALAADETEDGIGGSAVGLHRHEIDEVDSAALGFEVGLEDESAAAVTPDHAGATAGRSNSPEAVFLAAEKSGGAAGGARREGELRRTPCPRPARGRRRKGGEARQGAPAPWTPPCRPRGGGCGTSPFLARSAACWLTSLLAEPAGPRA